MNNMFVIIGIRRSGTSFLRREIELSKDVYGCTFEPHDLYYAVMMQKFKRFKDNKVYKDIINNFNNKVKSAGVKWQGLKLALNPGIDALDWLYFVNYFGNIKVIFIIRNRTDNFNSYYNMDKGITRGAVSKEVYNPFFDDIVNGFKTFHTLNPNRCCIVNYDNLFVNIESEFSKVYKLLNISKINGLHKSLKRPNFTGSK